MSRIKITQLSVGHPSVSARLGRVIGMHRRAVNRRAYERNIVAVLKNNPFKTLRYSEQTLYSQMRIGPAPVAVMGGKCGLSKLHCVPCPGPGPLDVVDGRLFSALSEKTDAYIAAVSAHIMAGATAMLFVPAEIPALPSAFKTIRTQPFVAPVKDGPETPEEAGIMDFLYGISAAFTSGSTEQINACCDRLKDANGGEYPTLGIDRADVLKSMLGKIRP
jgi:hypothetical protein